MTPGAIDTPHGLVPGWFHDDHFIDLDHGIWTPNPDGTWTPPATWLERNMPPV